MRQLRNLTNEADQLHTILFGDSEISFRLVFHPIAQMWTFDAEYSGVAVNGHKLSLGVLHMGSRNLPFDFIVTDNSETGLDPYQRDDWTTGRCTLYMLEPADMEVIRDGPVPL